MGHPESGELTQTLPRPWVTVIMDNFDATMSILFLSSPEYETVNYKNKFSLFYSITIFFSVCDVLLYLSRDSIVPNVIRRPF